MTYTGKSRLVRGTRLGRVILRISYMQVVTADVIGEYIVPRLVCTICAGGAFKPYEAYTYGDVYLVHDFILLDV